MRNIMVTVDELRKLCIRKFEAVGVQSEDAALATDVLIHADLRGVSSHGVMRLEHYVKRIQNGSINPTPQFSINETGPVTAVIDGDDGLGHLVAVYSMRQAIEICRKNGVGFVGIRNSSHCGALSYYVKLAADQGMIGMMMSNTDAMVAPYGGTQPFFGTNPMAYGFPAKRHQPVILDMSTSIVSYGKILSALNQGQSIPPDWAIDNQGKAITDPKDFAALLPIGGPKGYGLGMVVDVFSGLLTGTSFGPFVTKMYGDYTQKRKLGQWLGVIDPNRFTKGFTDQMDRLIDCLHSVPSAEGYERVMVPGELEHLKEEKGKFQGLSISESIYNYLIS